jgi:membrane protein
MPGCDARHPGRVGPSAEQVFMQVIQLVKDTVDKALDDKVFRLSAALSYYSIFSLAPLVLIAVSVAGAVFGEAAASGLLAETLTSSIGVDAANAVQDMVVRTRTPSDNILASVTGVLLLVIGATGVFAQLQDALNTVWSVQQKPGKVIRTLLRDRLQSFTMVLGIGFLLLTSLILTTGLQIASDLISRLVPVPAFVWSLLSSAISFLVVAALFGAIFRVLPDVEIAWQDVRFGALLTAGLFVLGKIVLGWYLGRAATASVYGSAGSLVLILLWVNYSSLILLFGAEFTQVHARSRGRVIRPSKGAVRVSRVTEAVADGVDATSSERLKPA